MARLMVIYATPKDTAAFDKYYVETHVPLAKNIPGLRRYEVRDGSVGSPGGDSGVHLIATLEFDDVAAIQAAFASAEGQTAAADVQLFAPGDAARMFIFENRSA